MKYIIFIAWVLVIFGMMKGAEAINNQHTENHSMQFKTDTGYNY